jgi:hypothetical protein
MEAKGCRCFIAPRDIKTGAEYASEIVTGINNSMAILLIFSESSNKSAYVLREINSGVSRNKMIIPLRIDDFLPSDAMEFYLGPTQWLDAFPEVLDIHVEKIVNLVTTIDKNIKSENNKSIQVEGPSLLKISEVKKLGYDNKHITLRAIELDYLCIPTESFNISIDQEGSFEDWCNYASEYGEDLTILLVKNDIIIGYCDVYPVNNDAYASLINGQTIIRDSMIDLYEFGGTFNAYIAMIAIDPENASIQNYFLIFDWIFSHLKDWEHRGVLIERIGISCYSRILEKILMQLGFLFTAYNPVKGKVFECTVDKLKNNLLVQKRFKYQ